MYRSYVENVVMHSLMSFQNTEMEMSSPSRSFIDAFLTKNGLPIHQAGNTDYKGKEYAKEIQNRDPRLADNIDEESGLRLNGVAAVYAASGYYANRYVNKDLINKPGGMSNTNTTDAPVMKLNEVMLPIIENYPPPAWKGKYIKIKYITQLPAGSVPSFVFFCNLPQWIKDPYKRFLENKIRDNWPMHGCPINVFIRQK